MEEEVKQWINRQRRISRGYIREAVYAVIGLIIAYVFFVVVHDKGQIEYYFACAAGGVMALVCLRGLTEAKEHQKLEGALQELENIVKDHRR